jgi:hypothetical protein
VSGVPGMARKEKNLQAVAGFAVSTKCVNMFMLIFMFIFVDKHVL